MHSVTCTITSKGQITIPKSIRKQLGVDPADKVTFVVHESGQVELRPVRFTIEQLKGIVPALAGRDVDDFDDLIEEAMEQDIRRIEALDDE